eukprot:1142522-Pelagomonas_calceolata.AAC.2
MHASEGSLLYVHMLCTGRTKTLMSWSATHYPCRRLSMPSAECGAIMTGVERACCLMNGFGHEMKLKNELCLQSNPSDCQPGVSVKQAGLTTVNASLVVCRGPVGEMTNSAAQAAAKLTLAAGQEVTRASIPVGNHRMG